jgi:Family of unknown function (DUF6328)
MATGPEESQKERVDRELIELLNELRVALPGIQVLFAFLLIVPFTNGWQRLAHRDRVIYVVALVLAALASGFLMAPSAHHRLHFRHEDKEQLVIWGSRLALCGLVSLALAIASSFVVVADFISGPWIAIPLSLGVLLFFGVVWFVLPLLYGNTRRGRTSRART